MAENAAKLMVFCRFQTMNFNARSITDVNPTWNNVENTTQSPHHPTWNHKPNAKQRLIRLSFVWWPQSHPTRNTPDMKRRHLWGNYPFKCWHFCRRAGRWILFLFCLIWPSLPAHVHLQTSFMWHGHQTPWKYLEGVCRRLQHWPGTDRANWDNHSYEITELDGLNFRTETLDGFLGNKRILGGGGGFYGEKPCPTATLDEILVGVPTLFSRFRSPFQICTWTSPLYSGRLADQWVQFSSLILDLNMRAQPLRNPKLQHPQWSLNNHVHSFFSLFLSLYTYIYIYMYIYCLFLIFLLLCLSISVSKIFDVDQTIHKLLKWGSSWGWGRLWHGPETDNAHFRVIWMHTFHFEARLPICCIAALRFHDWKAKIVAVWATEAMWVHNRKRGSKWVPWAKNQMNSETVKIG